VPKTGFPEAEPRAGSGPAAAGRPDGGRVIVGAAASWAAVGRNIGGGGGSQTKQTSVPWYRQGWRDEEGWLPDIGWERSGVCTPGDHGAPFISVRISESDECWAAGHRCGCGSTECGGGRVKCAAGRKERPEAVDDGSFHPVIIFFVAKTVV
jgi:hypothetical protein